MNLGLYDSVIRWSSYSCMSVCVYVCVPIVCQSISFSSVFLLVKKKTDRSKWGSKFYTNVKNLKNQLKPRGRVALFCQLLDLKTPGPA